MEGLELLKSVTQPAYLKQPEQDLSIFAEHHTQDAWLNLWRGASMQGCWRYDKHAAFLACASSVKLGVGSYVQHREIHYTGQAGLYLLDIPVGYEETCPLPLSTGASWHYAPMLQLLAQTGILFAVRECYIWPEQHYCLRAFYQHCKAKREAGESVKHLYTQAFGMLAHCPEHLWPNCLYRPDWYHELKAECKARMYRHAWQVWLAEGIWPIAMNVDSLTYERKVSSLRLGDGIGAFSEVQL